MRVRRRFAPLEDIHISPGFWKWVGIGAGAVLAGYLTAYLILFPAPMPTHFQNPGLM